MLHIRPVEEKDASEKVQQIYKDIKETLGIHFVPLIFQYLAGFEEYFQYGWEKYKANLESDYYTKAVEEIISLSERSIRGVYSESREMLAFIKNMHMEEKKHILQTAKELEVLNAKLLLLSIGLREGVKGVVIGQHFLPKTGTYEETVFDQFINQKIMHANIKMQEKEVVPATRMLAPLFGSNAIVVSKYPEFFAYIAKEMEELVKSEKFLHQRVVMEQQTLLQSLHLPYPLGCSYREIASFAGKKPYFSELLYILSETFPTKFPRLLFTSSVMKQVVEEK